MTHTITVRGVNCALSEALHWLRVSGEYESSRNGPVIVAPGPVLTTYTAPLERVLFNPERDANPFFHLFEAIWMLGGRNDLAFPKQFNSRFGEYSDNGETLHGAYGFRWREWFGFDQLRELVHHLRSEPNTRRAVLAMWSPNGDLVSSEGVGGPAVRDLPCNTHCYFDRRGGRLNMTVCCRSNDAIWGAYGANAVHMSLLLEYMAAAIGCEVGEYRQFSNNLHAYTNIADPSRDDPRNARLREAVDYYSVLNGVRPTPVFTVLGDQDALNEDITAFLENPSSLRQYNNPFFHETAHPMYEAWVLRKAGLGSGMEAIDRVVGSDWRTACAEWITRREVANGRTA